MHSKYSFVCDGCEKIVFKKPKHKIHVFTTQWNPIPRFYCSDECLAKSGDFTV